MDNTDSITIREHTTASIPFTVYSDDVAVDLSSADHVELNMIDNKKKVYHYSTVTSGITLSSATLGFVEFFPPSESVFAYDRTPYKFYCWVYLSSGIKYSVPRDSAAIINVLREY